MQIIQKTRDSPKIIKNLRHTIDDMRIGSHAASVTMNDLAQQENIPDSVASSK